jgi:hypothetical protein
MKGSRNLLSKAFIDALAKEFQEHGAEAIRIVRVERPHEFLKVVASLLPKEFATFPIGRVSACRMHCALEATGQGLAQLVARHEEAFSVLGASFVKFKLFRIRTIVV